jgi:hypothetical protein
MNNGKTTLNNEKYMKLINNCPFEKIHIQFCKLLVGVRKQTSNIATRAEIGRFPLIIEVHISIIKYWLRLNKLKNEKLVVEALNTNLYMQGKGLYTWTTLVKHILDEANFSEVWMQKKHLTKLSETD